MVSSKNKFQRTIF